LIFTGNEFRGRLKDFYKDSKTQSQMAGGIFIIFGETLSLRGFVAKNNAF
jgi:hypothetical protein